MKTDDGEFGPSCRDTVIAQALDVGLAMVECTRKRASLEGVEVKIVDRPRPPKQGRLDGEAQARLIALRCSPAPDGRDRWTLELQDTLAREVAAWEQERNATATGVDWRFTTEDARIKL